MNLARFLTEERVDLDLDEVFDEERPATVESVTEHMATLLERSQQIVNATKMRTDLVNRERRSASLLGDALFMPHVRTLQARRLVMAVGISREGLALPTPDDVPVQLVISFVGPTYDDKLYLQVYKRLSERLTISGWIDRIVQSSQPGEVVRALSM